MTFFRVAILLILALLLFVGFEVGILRLSSSFVVGERSVQKYADTIFQKCSSQGYSRVCYDKEIPRLMETISMEEAFAVARLIQEKDPKYLECHVLAHYLSEREAAKDPSRWKDVVARCPVSMCNNGCPHGALMARFGNQEEFLSDEQIDEIKPDLMDVCEPRGIWNPTEVERSMCYHAIGHLNMYATNADINKSVDICKEIGVKKDGRNYVQTCTEGVLMSVYQPLGPEDTALVAAIKPSRDKLDSFCANYTGEAFHACHREAWPLFFPEILQPLGLKKLCTYTEDEEQQIKCYSTIMNLITVILVIDNNSIESLKDFCTGLPDERVGLCFENAARRLIQIDPLYAEKAVEICGVAETVSVGRECYTRLVTYASVSFHLGSEEFIGYCKKLPAPWDKQCLNTSRT